MIHIKETEIIPFLKTAQTGYTKMISEGDLEMEVELAEKVEVHKRQYQPFTPHGSNARVSDGSRPDGKQVLSIFVANGEG